MQNFVAIKLNFSPVNSTCIPKFNSFECRCDNEFCDMQCDEEKCQNGNCHENGVCICDVGYKGDNCEIQISECDKSPCSEEGAMIATVVSQVIIVVISAMDGWEKLPTPSTIGLD